MVPRRQSRWLGGLRGYLHIPDEVLLLRKMWPDRTIEMAHGVSNDIAKSAKSNLNDVSLTNERTTAIGRLLLPPAITGAHTMPIRRYLQDNAAFDPNGITAMSEALEQACAALQIDGHLGDREVIAARIIDLARNGVIDAKALSERVVAEAKALRSL